MDDEYDREDRRVQNTVWMIDRCRELGGVDLDPQGKRTIGFERRPLSPDRRPRTAPAWGEAPADRY